LVGSCNNAKGLTAALEEIERNSIPGASITVNLIYVNPRAVGWQILLLQLLHSAAVPIEELTIGAGVPLVEVANEYIRPSV